MSCISHEYIIEETTKDTRIDSDGYKFINCKCRCKNCQKIINLGINIEDKCKTKEAKFIHERY